MALWKEPTPAEPERPVKEPRDRVQRAIERAKDLLHRGSSSAAEVAVPDVPVREVPVEIETASLIPGLEEKFGEEEINVEILRQRVRARAAEDPDARTFGWIARVGAALRRARESRGLTQAILSEKTTITQGYLSSLETGKLVRGPTIDVLYRYAAALNCNCEITFRDQQSGAVITSVQASDSKPPISADTPVYHSPYAGSV